MIDLMAKKKIFFGISIAILIIGIAAYFINGFKLNIDFEGGEIWQISMKDSNFDTKKVEELVLSKVNKPVEAYKSKDTAKNVDLLTINIAKEHIMTGEERESVINSIRESFKVEANSDLLVQTVAPFIGQEILNNGIQAILWASFLIILYIWFRFRSMSSGPSAGVMAIIALLHDVLIMVTVYLVFKIPVNESFIAAVLTVYGYSMNDTIIIYDRIRENSNLLRKIPIAELANRSIMQTLARSINTVVTVLICLITTYFFAMYFNIATIEEFTLPLIIGVASGCYSSIFIATPLWVVWKESQAQKKVAVK